MKPLFGYGTFRHRAWRRAILGADYPARHATIEGWRRVALASGYLSLVPSATDRVEGVLVDLDETGWRIADAWEEVPRYARLEVIAHAADGPLAAEMYVCDSDEHAVPFESERFALLSDPEVEASIRRFTRAMLALRAGSP